MNVMPERTAHIGWDITRLGIILQTALASSYWGLTGRDFKSTGGTEGGKGGGGAGGEERVGLSTDVLGLKPVP